MWKAAAPIAFLTAIGMGSLARAATPPPHATLTAVAAAPALDPAVEWTGAAHVTAGWDFTHGRVAAQPADVAFVTDRTSLYVRFVVPQRQPITATQAVDGVGENSDDTVTVRLWAGGVSGFAYDFRATLRGRLRRATWCRCGFRFRRFAAAGAARGACSSSATSRPTTNATSGRTRPNKARRIRSFTPVSWTASMPARKPRGRRRASGSTRSGRPVPPEYGGDTSRMGADVAVPITPTASLVATFHPDFSNVESDQQTITPTTFTRFYPELRPFFAQGAHFYDYNSCYECPGAGWSELYTTAIPTPRTGYQLEGTQGPLTFGALDAIGFGRIDRAQSIAYTTPSNVLTANYTRVNSDQVR